MRKLIFFALLTAGSAMPAMAQESAPFTGPRVEAIVGWDRPNVNGGHDDGAAYGVGIGYDFQAGGAVLGVEAEAADSTAKECARDVTVAGDRLCAKAKRDLYVGGRIGAAIGDNTLLYAKGGYTNARVGIDYEDGASGAGDTSSAANLDGVRVGGGIEHRLGGNAYLKGEYRYSNYEAGVERHQVVAGVGLRF